MFNTSPWNTPNKKKLCPEGICVHSVEIVKRVYFWSYCTPFYYINLFGPINSSLSLCLSCSISIALPPVATKLNPLTSPGIYNWGVFMSRVLNFGIRNGKQTEFYFHLCCKPFWKPTSCLLQFNSWPNQNNFTLYKCPSLPNALLQFYFKIHTLENLHLPTGVYELSEVIWN